MTCIAGVAQNGKVVIGGDSAGLGGWTLTVRADVKVWATDGWVFGFTSSFRMGQVLRWNLNLPPVGDKPLDAYMATTFIDAVRGALKESGWLKIENNREEGGAFLVGTSGRLFCVEEDLQVGESADGYMAVGCGEDQALGAFYATQRIKDPRKRVSVALRAAERHSGGVRGPFHIVEAGA